MLSSPTLVNWRGAPPFKGCRQRFDDPPCTPTYSSAEPSGLHRTGVDSELIGISGSFSTVPSASERIATCLRPLNSRIWQTICFPSGETNGYCACACCADNRTGVPPLTGTFHTDGLLDGQDVYTTH